MMSTSKPAVEVLSALENSKETTERCFRIKHLFILHTIHEVITCTTIHAWSHQLSQDATMMLTRWKVTPHKSCWLAIDLIRNDDASQQLLWGVTFHSDDIVVASWGKWWLPGCIIVQGITSWIVWYKVVLENWVSTKVSSGFTNIQKTEWKPVFSSSIISKEERVTSQDLWHVATMNTGG